MNGETGNVNKIDSKNLLERYDKVLRIRINHSYAGFFAYVTFVLNQLIYCEAHDLFPVVYFGPDSEDGPNGFYDERYGDNTWDYYFEPVAGLTYEDVQIRIRDPKDPLSSEDIIELSTGFLWELHAYEPSSIYNYPYGYYKDLDQDIDRWYDLQRSKARHCLSKYVWPKKHILAKVEEFWSTHLKESPVLGVHMRGSDKGTADAAPQLMRIVKPEEYYPHIDRFLRESPSGRVFLATDQSQYADNVLAQYGKRVVTRDVMRVLDFGRGTNIFQRKDCDAYLKGEEVLIDCLLLARSDFLLRCTSAVGEYAMYFSEDLKCIDLNRLETPHPSTSSKHLDTVPDKHGDDARETAPAASDQPHAVSPGKATIDHEYCRSLFGAGRLFEGAMLINLDSRPDRLERSMSELKRYGIDDCVTRMSAYKHEHGMYGCSISHLEAVKYARRKGWKSVLIFEDDIKIMPDFAEHAPLSLHDLSEREWGLFQFGAMLPSRLEFVTPHLFRFKHAAGGHAFALHERTYDLLIEQYICELDQGNWSEPAHYPFDEYLNNLLTYEFDAFASAKLLISQHAGSSDTSNTQVDYRGMMEEKYEQLSSASAAVGEQQAYRYEGGNGRSTPAARAASSRCVVSFAGASIAIEWFRPEYDNLARFLFGRAACDLWWPTHVDFRIGADASGLPALWFGDDLIYSGESHDTLALNLLEKVRHQLAVGRGRTGSLLCAGALTVGLRAVIIPGKSGVGKTTLTASLLSDLEDCKFLSDELIFVSPCDKYVSGFDKPLGIEHSSLSVLSKRSGFDPHAKGVLSTRAGYLARPESFGGVASPEGAELNLILFPARDAGRTPELRRLSEAEASLQLMSALVNARNLPRHGLGEIARLARSVPAFELRYDDYGQVAEHLQSLLSEYTRR